MNNYTDTLRVLCNNYHALGTDKDPALHLLKRQLAEEIAKNNIEEKKSPYQLKSGKSNASMK